MNDTLYTPEELKKKRAAGRVHIRDHEVLFFGPLQVSQDDWDSIFGDKKWQKKQ
jgi:hypothetical protein